MNFYLEFRERGCLSISTDDVYKVLGIPYKGIIKHEESELHDVVCEWIRSLLMLEEDTPMTLD